MSRRDKMILALSFKARNVFNKVFRCVSDD